MEKDEILIKIENNLPLIILIMSTLIGAYFVMPLFNPGIPVNVDLSFHYAKVKCAKDLNQFILPSSWCPYSGTGIPSYQAYSPLGGILSLILSFVFGLELAYKLVLVLIYFGTAFAAYLIAKKAKNALAGSFVYAFLLFEQGGWDLGGFTQIFLVQWPNSLGLAMLLFAVYFTYNLFENPTKKNLLLTSLFAALLFISHAMHIIFYFIMALIMFFFFYDNVKKNLKLFVLLPVLGLLLVGFWFLPLLPKLSFFRSGWGVWKLDPFYWKNFFISQINNILLILGFLTALIFIKSKSKLTRIISFSLLSIPLLYILSNLFPKIWLNFPLFNQLYFPRLSGEIRIFSFILAAILIASLSKIKINKKLINLKIISIAIFLLIAIPMLPNTLRSSKSIVLDKTDEFRYFKSIQQYFDEPGSIIVEDTLFYLGGPFSLSHSACSWGVDLKRPLYGACPRDHIQEQTFQDSEVGRLFGRPINTIPTENITELLEDFNIKYIVAFSDNYKKSFEFLKIKANHSPWIIFETSINETFFDVKNGKLMSEISLPLEKIAIINCENDCSVRIKLRAYPNWEIKINRERTGYEVDDTNFMVIPLKSGDNKIEVNYNIKPLDIASFVVSAVVFIVIVCLLFISYKKDKSNKSAKS